MYELYIISKDEKKFKNLYENIIKIQETITNKELYDGIVTKAKQGDLCSWIYVNKAYNIRPMIYHNGKITVKSWDLFLNAPILEFIRTAKITFLNKDALEIYNEYKMNSKAFIFLDPPYLLSSNSFYKDPTANIYEYLFDNDIRKNKALVILCLENNWIIKLLFKGCKYITYVKKYEVSKKITEHIIIINKKELKIY